jgi:hypothetical protein
MRTLLGGYEKYRFKEHDPVLDKISRLYELAGLVKANGRVDIKRVAYLSGLSEGTLSRWENRHVKRPQHPAVQAVVRACGGQYEITYRGQSLGRNITTKSRSDVVAASTRRRKKKGSHLRVVRAAA